MQLNPYLTFNGRCEGAFQFYERCLGGKIVTMMAYAGTPTEGHVPPEWRNKILHARLVVGDEALMGCDTPPERYEQPKGFAVLLEMKEAGEHATHISGVVRKWESADAAPADLLGRPIRHAGRSIRCTVDDQLWRRLSVWRV